MRGDFFSLSLYWTQFPNQKCHEVSRKTSHLSSKTNSKHENEPTKTNWQTSHGPSWPNRREVFERKKKVENVCVRKIFTLLNSL